MVTRIIDGDELKNIAGQVLTYNSKNFHWLNRKLDLERTMNGLGKPLRKKSDPKTRKRNSKSQSQIAACEQKKTNGEKANFCSNTVFSLYLKIRVKKFHTGKPLAFSLNFLFRRYPKSLLFDFKNHENVWTDLKKRQRPNTIQILWIVKNIAEQVLNYNPNNWFSFDLTEYKPC